MPSPEDPPGVYVLQESHDEYHTNDALNALSKATPRDM